MIKYQCLDITFQTYLNVIYQTTEKATRDRHVLALVQSTLDISRLALKRYYK